MASSPNITARKQMELTLEHERRRLLRMQIIQATNVAPGNGM